MLTAWTRGPVAAGAPGVGAGAFSSRHAPVCVRSDTPPGTGTAASTVPPTSKVW
ncbi:MAG: hypothetical protein H6704_09010 [Myxococcales bacterium]|nr:hypothetical protein [Myxococcales bacterium]